MTPDSESFDSLRKLLALKRHEVPPPGYFHGFSREVIIRIKASDAQETAGFVVEGSWLRRFWGLFETRPMLAGGFGVAICGFFVVGALISSESSEVSGLAQAAPLSINNGAGTPTETARLQQVSAELPSAIGAPASTLSGGSLFDQINQLQRGQGQPVLFQTSPAGGN
jgi:hypothetical protein